MTDAKAIRDQLKTSTLLKELMEDPRFQMVMAEVVSQRPVVPAYLPKPVRADSDALIEQIKFLSGSQRGFDLLYGILTGVLLSG